MKNIVLEAVTGSRAYGLNHEKSDTDKMGIFVAPTVEVAGLDWASKHESWSNAGPTGDDQTYHEIGKYLKLLLKSNPTLIELMFMNDYDILTSEGQGIIDIRDSFLYTEGIRNAYYGYAAAQHARVLREWPDHKPKMARHCLRITNQAIELLTTGSCNPKVSNPQQYFDLDKLSVTELDRVMSEAIDKILTCDSVLAEKPDRNTVRDFLAEVRKNN
jgi:predicted nucleotidyltransferase